MLGFCIFYEKKLHITIKTNQNLYIELPKAFFELLYSNKIMHFKSAARKHICMKICFNRTCFKYKTR